MYMMSRVQTVKERDGHKCKRHPVLAFNQNWISPITITILILRCYTQTSTMRQGEHSRFCCAYCECTCEVEKYGDRTTTHMVGVHICLGLNQCLDHRQVTIRGGLHECRYALKSNIRSLIDRSWYNNTEKTNSAQSELKWWFVNYLPHSYHSVVSQSNTTTYYRTLNGLKSTTSGYYNNHHTTQLFKTTYDRTYRG